MNITKMKKNFLSVSLFICFLIVVFSAFKMHPYHVGSLETNYNSKSKTFEITGRFYLDDLEHALNQKYSTSMHFGEEKYKSQLNDYLKKYCAENLRMKSDNNFLKINYLGFQEDRESVDIFLETEPISTPKKVEVSTSFLYNLFDDQTNIIHIIVNGNRKSDKLIYPNRYLYQMY